MILNSFWIPGKVPSFNELLNYKALMKKVTPGIILRRGQKKGSYTFNQYNEVKQQWKAKTCKIVTEKALKHVVSCYFTYLLVEKTRKRDPSNICSAAIKFIEDGIVLAGIMPNDGWDNVLGITNYWTHQKEMEPGVLVAMATCPVDKPEMMLLLKEHNEERSGLAI